VLGVKRRLQFCIKDYVNIGVDSFINRLNNLEYEPLALDVMFEFSYPIPVGLRARLQNATEDQINAYIERQNVGMTASYRYVDLLNF